MQMNKEGALFCVDTMEGDLHGWPSHQVQESLKVHFVFHALYHLPPPKDGPLPPALMSLCQFIS